MNERGHALVETSILLPLVLGAAILAGATLFEGTRRRLCEHENFFLARRALVQSKWKLPRRPSRACGFGVDFLLRKPKVNP
jgi:hypothetical protein